MYLAESPWAVAGDAAHTRSITSNFITGALATAATGARDHTHHPRHHPARRPDPPHHPRRPLTSCRRRREDLRGRSSRARPFGIWAGGRTAGQGPRPERDFREELAQGSCCSCRPGAGAVDGLEAAGLLALALPPP
ncbi:SPW repeat protein [Streptomyces sp. NPDC127112]|uniref:SPW repeat domain-containing protein n=1 Tax=Streptomyces sp. NPDC127112 TaxID=3345364 RepID=UPI00363F0506